MQGCVSDGRPGVELCRLGLRVGGLGSNLVFYLEPDSLPMELAWSSHGLQGVTGSGASPTIECRLCSAFFFFPQPKCDMDSSSSTASCCDGVMYSSRSQIVGYSIAAVCTGSSAGVFCAEWSRLNRVEVPMRMQAGVQAVWS